MKTKEPELQIGYEPTNPQYAFHSSKAFVRGYGGAVGGGKSRAICEEVLVLCLIHPGLKVLIARQAHTAIVETTRSTMLEQVMPPQLIAKRKQSGGEDFIELVNGSRIHFVGLEDPIRWFSSELGLIVFDEAHEIPQETVIKLITRLRQRCLDCVKTGHVDCTHMPNKVVIAFNPDNPGHWLQKWFILGANRTQYGFYKKHLTPDDAYKALGDSEFIFANARDNPHLPENYIDKLEGMPEAYRRRYLEGEWVPVEGTCFFDVDALEAYRPRLQAPKVVGRSDGTIGSRKDKPRVITDKSGGWSIWKYPVRARRHPGSGQKIPGHRYIAAVDVSSGGASDYSAIQIVDVNEFEQVARYQGKLDPDLVALEAARLGAVYNDAMIAPEITGGWGFSVVKALQRLKYRRIYTRRIEDRLSNRWTDALGWSTTQKSRAYMLDTLEQALREGEFGLYDEVTHLELGYFMRDDRGRPAALVGMNDDLVMSLAIAVTLATQLPREHKPLREEPYSPIFGATGY